MFKEFQYRTPLFFEVEILESLDLSVTVLTCQDHEPKQSYLHLLDDAPQGLMILNIDTTQNSERSIV